MRSLPFDAETKMEYPPSDLRKHGVMEGDYAYKP